VAGTESLIAKYRDQVHFVVIYVVEPHPAGSASPYSGQEWTASYSQDTEGNPVGQPGTYDERAGLASMCAKDAGITALVLVDEMDNPVWQTYGPAPNLAYLIGTDRKVIEAQTWYDVSEMEASIESYLDASSTP
jgi:hypothetical protein